MPTEELKKLHATFRKTLLEPAGHFHPFFNSGEQPSDENPINSATAKGVCGVSDGTAIELHGGEEESKKEEHTTRQFVSLEKTRTHSINTTHNDCELVTVPCSGIGTNTKSEPRAVQNVNKRNETGYKQPRVALTLTPCSTTGSQSDGDKRGNNELVSLGETDTYSPGNAALFSDKEFNLLTNPDSTIEARDTSTDVDNTRKVDFKLDETIYLPSASSPSSQDSTLFCKPMVAPDLPCNVVNKVCYS